MASPPSWPIFREKYDEQNRLERVAGRSRTIFVHHGGPALISNLAVYADGIIAFAATVACDFNSFKNLLEDGEIGPAPGSPDGSFFFESRGSGLGYIGSGAFQPRTTPDDLADWALATITQLNPAGAGLLDCAPFVHDPIDPRWPLQRTRRGAQARAAQFARIDGRGNRIAGQKYAVIRHQNGTFALTDWMIYADGTSQLGPAGAVMPFADIAALISSGQIVASVPDGEWLDMDGLGLLRPENAHWWKTSQGLLGEAQDILTILQGGEGCTSFCLRAERAYFDDPSPGNLDLLREAYDLVPDHMRTFGLLGMEDQVRWLLGLSSKPYPDNFPTGYQMTLRAQRAGRTYGPDRKPTPA